MDSVFELHGIGAELGEIHMPNQESRRKRYCLLDPQGEDLLAPSQGETQDVVEFGSVRLQALISQWLRMENVVALIAAGCSVPHGGLVVAELEKAVLQIVAAHYERLGEEALAAFVRARLADTKALSFEGWLSYLTNVAFLQGSSNSPVEHVVWSGGSEFDAASLRKLVNDLGCAVLSYCSLQLPDRITDATGHHAFLGKMVARDPSLGRLRVFTLNYDTLIEQALDQLGIQYADGFVGQAERRFDPSCYGLDIYYPGEVSEGRVRRYDKYAQLYKLHGSIHWHSEEDGLVRAIHPSLDALATWRKRVQQPAASPEYQVALQEFAQLCSERARQPAILPTANKFTQTLDLPFAHLFRAFQQSLHQSQTFAIVIGYGFGDEHVNRVLEDALVNPSLVLLVVNPSARQDIVNRVQKYQRAGARVYLLTGEPVAEAEHASRPGTFDDFATNVLPNVAWMDDWAKMKRLESTLRRDRATELGAGRGE